MLKKPTVRHSSRGFRIVSLVAVALLAACAPAVSTEQVQMQVATGVAQTVAAQNGMATSVALTATAMAPTITPTPPPIEMPLVLPTLTPIIAISTVTPFVASSGGGGGSSVTVPDYACSFVEVKPLINVFKPTDYIDIVWIITNTGKKTWASGLDLDFVSGTRFSPYNGQELPALKSGEKVTISFEGNAPSEPGYYEMKFKVQGGLCFPFIDIQVIKPPGSGS
jgi:Ig-like domain from next to BRCA1 gene